jgi:hypothetical protein
LVAALPHDRCGRFKPNADSATLVDISALGGNSTDDILGGQYRSHVAATLTGRLPSQAIVGVNRFSTASLQFTRVIPEIDIWRAANLMLKRYGEKAFEESSTRADELAADGDHDGASTWRRITAAVEQLATNPVAAASPELGTSRAQDRQDAAGVSARLVLTCWREGLS